MTPQEFRQCVELAELDQAFNGYKKEAKEYETLILQCWEVLKRCQDQS